MKIDNWRGPYSGRINSLTNVYLTEDYLDNDYLKSISPLITQGIGIGGIVNVRLIKKLDLRFTPMFVFTDLKLLFKYDDGTEVEKKTNTTLTELPLSLKLKSERLGNFRVYILGGLKYAFDITARKNVDKLTDLAFKRSFLSYEAGLGLDINFEWFKVSPEIKLSHSFNNILEHRTNPFSTPIEKAKLRSFTFTLIFQ